MCLWERAFHFPLESPRLSSPLPVIAPHGYLSLFLSVFSGTSINGNGNVRLLIGGVTIDQINIPSLKLDQSYARIPDGSSSWQVTNTLSTFSENVTVTVQ
jgi:hypothetical protein